jgi:hypothetical protein
MNRPEMARHVDPAVEIEGCERQSKSSQGILE